jgi:hypothetical protein
MGWFRNQWEQVRGNFKYEVGRSFAVWFLAKFGVSMIATLTALIAFVLGHREIAVLTAIPAGFWVAQSIVVWHRTKTLKLKLVPHGENSPDLYLEVVNLSNTAQISAEIRVVKKSYGEGVKRYPYVGIWSGPIFAMEGWNQMMPVRDHGERTKISISKGKSHLLRIGAMNQDDNYNQSTLDLVGIEEKLMWDFEPTPNSHLPFFVLNVKIFGEGFTNTISKDYKVGPKTFRGPTEMMEFPV